MKNVLTLLFIVVLVAGCNDQDFKLPGNVKIDVDQYQCDFVFTGLPVNVFLVIPQNYPPGTVRGLYPSGAVADILWDFGDGHTSNETSPVHTFINPGQHAISVQNGKPKGSRDTTIRVFRLPLIGSKKTEENGKVLLNYPGTGYSVIHTLNRSTSSDEWWLLSTSEKFDSLSSVKLPLYLGVPRINKRGNLLFVNGSIREMNRTGTILKQITMPSWSAQYVLELSDGYLVGGTSGFTGKTYTARLNNDFEVIRQTEFDLRRTGYSLNFLELESEEVIRLHYYTSTNTTTLTKINLTGDVLFEKQLGSTPAGRSFKLSSGYLLAGFQRPEYDRARSVFTKVTNDGTVEWTKESVVESPQYIHSGAIEVIELNGFVYIFFDNQKGIKVDMTTGQLIWSKRFGISTDTFDAAILNDSGNITILGAHQFDYTKFEFATDHLLRDLSFTEINLDGEIVVK